MILLKFTQSDYDQAYHLFANKKQMHDYLNEHYDNVQFYSDEQLVCMDFDDMRIYAKIIQPIVHLAKTNKL